MPGAVVIVTVFRFDERPAPARGGAFAPSRSSLPRRMMRWLSGWI